MDLHDWLLNSRLMTLDQYKETVAAQYRGSIAGVKFVDGFIDGDSSQGSNLVRKHPIGDVIESLPFKNEIYNNAGVTSLGELVDKWQQWHVSNIEPIATYSTSSRVGKNVYARQEEKKLVARFVNQERIGTGPLIQNSDTVVIPEGSSAFYVGLAIAAIRKRVSIVTSNALLCREYLDNPALAKSFKDFYAIGGLADKDSSLSRSEHGGYFGPDAQYAYEIAIKDRPAATVVIMPVSGLLHRDGPYATDDFIRALKYSIIRASLTDERRVREFVFIADYSKHLPQNVDSYGAPVVEREEWAKLLKQNQGRISVVTAPPPSLRTAFSSGMYSHPVNRSLEGIKPGLPFGDDDRTYCKTCSELAKVFYDGGSRSTFHEAYFSHKSEELAPV